MAEVRLCAADEVEPNSVKRFDVDGYRLAVVRVRPEEDATGEGGEAGEAGDEWYVVDDRCTHAEASLAEGYLFPEERELECPRHSSVFELISGEPLTLPATKPQGTYAVRLEDDDVLVELP